MKKISGLVFAVMFCAAGALAAEQTWTGEISDSMCGHSHKSMIEHAGKKLTAHDCTIACVKDGSKYVFVSGGKIYNIANQSLPALQEHAGHPIQLTGNLAGDTITVTKVSMAGGRSGKSGA